MSGTCRCCLSGGAGVNIFHKLEEYDGLGYSDMIRAITPNKVYRSDKLPHVICQACVLDLKQAYNFHLKCNKSHDSLMLLRQSPGDPVIVLDRDKCNQEVAEKQELPVDQEDENLDEGLPVDNAELDVDFTNIKGQIKMELPEGSDGEVVYEDMDDGLEDPDTVVSGIVKLEAVTPDEVLEESVITGSQTRDKKLKHICTVCSEAFRFKDNLKKHMKTVHPTPKSVCTICFKEYQSMSKHMVRYHKIRERGDLQCDLCEFKTLSSKSFSLHMDKHRVKGQLPCKICNKMYPSIRSFRKHTMRHKEKSHVCHVCSKAFILKYSLTEHLRKHTGEKPFGCPVCKKMFRTTQNRANHIKTHTDVENLDETTLAEFLELKEQIDKKRRGAYVKKKLPKNNLTCNHCNKKFVRLEVLKDHVNKHLGIMEYYCKICEKFVPSEKRHKYFHRCKDEKPTCPVCQKVFCTKSTLTTHMRRHTKEKPYACSMCDMRFAQIASLRMHEKRHSKEKNFVCHLCSKAFDSKYKLDIHFRSHTNERPYVCDICTKGFYTGYQLKLHKTRHAPEATLQCPLCDRKTRTNGDLRAHLKTHYRKRKHPCRLCDKLFMRSDHRLRHERQVHNYYENTTAVPALPDEPEDGDQNMSTNSVESS